MAEQTVEDLGRLVKGKYPGVYDSLPDADVGAKVKAKYPDAYGHFTDISAQPAKPASFAEEHPIINGALDAAKGVGSGVMSTVVGGGDLIRRALGMDRIIDNPDVKQLTTAPDSIPGKIGRFVEQAAEFAIPASGVSKLTKGMGLIPRLAAEAGTAAGVGAVQSGGDPVSTMTAGAAGAAGPILGKAAEAVGSSSAAKKLYQSALKPTWSMAKNDGLKMLDTGLKEQIPVSDKGLAKVESTIKDLQQKINDGIVSRSRLGASVDTSKVLSTLDDLENFYKNSAAPKKPLETLKGLRDEFEQFHGQQIPLDKAQQIKINTYQLIKDSYGEMASAKIEGLKQVARGLKDEISAAFPEVAGLNEQQSKMLDLGDALYRAVWRIENHQLMGIGSPLAASAGHAMLGGPGAATGFLGKLVLDNPTIKSKLAIQLAQAGVKNPNAVVTARMAALKGAVEKGVTEIRQPSARYQLAADATDPTQSGQEPTLSALR